ncbi:unnamed protein product, partial [Protopolystoma xenopodis]
HCPLQTQLCWSPTEITEATRQSSNDDCRAPSAGGRMNKSRLLRSAAAYIAFLAGILRQAEDSDSSGRMESLEPEVEKGLLLLRGHSNWEYKR